jgi:malyl-CoA/(S)-citramalyl-CoA lyase
MAASAADVINLDLEDSVAPSDKDAARANVIEAINTIDWGNKYISVRINGLDTPYWYKDVVDIMEQAGDRLDQIMIPKVGCAEDVYAVDALVTAIERAKGRAKPVSFEVIIESAAGIAHVEAIAGLKPAPSGNEPWCGRLCGLNGHANNGYRRNAGKLLHAARR